jgi:hypothetical protein
MTATCQDLDEQDSLKSIIQRLRRCQAADQRRIQEVLRRVVDLGVNAQTVPGASSWRRTEHDAENATSEGVFSKSIVQVFLQETVRTGLKAALYFVRHPEHSISPQLTAFHDTIPASEQSVKATTRSMYSIVDRTCVLGLD